MFVFSLLPCTCNIGIPNLHSAEPNLYRYSFSMTVNRPIPLHLKTRILSVSVRWLFCDVSISKRDLGAFLYCNISYIHNLHKNWNVVIKPTRIMFLTFSSLIGRSTTLMLTTPGWFCWTRICYMSRAWAREIKQIARAVVLT